MALADINVKKPREAQIWNCSTELWFIGFYRTEIICDKTKRIIAAHSFVERMNGNYALVPYASL